ncbi:single-stranded DNA-binding protein [Empedobacter falsenii]|uniref:Single-stranded DNA-binding protein n=1 Tax=Empedobacter falsenii TaxID=343874 RepID=A0A7H9DQL4_9FLAO|nr:MULTISPECIES: single-stranded DNA-binding protein [Empedobacter]MDH2206784.1 single-stranded DNA-binding protein [Empedobacter sp. GD03644]MDM1063246.1 single-stranded DNA-binding protein [Empedobacter falsenii]MDM1548675.1 single-stranded DNA-binding protein [Empedobacter falsenii]MDM1549658.1 single-stranded DNA-binding protein [Empedobacter falsenii]QLL57462.1 single-stranded DNA-binding protein [Empedobacter falsenii]
MSTLRNKVQLIGNVGSNPEVKTLENEKKLAKFSLATNESYTNSKGEKVQQTTWHNLVAYGPIVNVIEKHVEKGKQLAIEGKLTYRDYQDKDDQQKTITEIIIDEIVLL